MGKSNRILALDIGASSVKMAEFVALGSGGLELTNFGNASLGLDPQSEGDRSAYIVTTIRELLRENAIAPGHVQCSVSGQSVFSRFVKLPPVDSEKVYQIILYEAQQNVPFPIDEVVWDYQLIGRGEGELDVLLAAIKADIIESITDCIQTADLEPDLVDMAPMALYNAVRYNYADLQGCSLIVDIGARSTDLIFLEEGRMFSRSIPVAGNAVTKQIMREFDMSFADAEELKKAHAFVAFGGAYEEPASEVAAKVSKSVRSVMTRMHAEINRSISFYRSQQSGARPQYVLLTGGSSVIPYTDTFLKEKLKIDVDYLNPFLNVAVSEDISAEEIGKCAHLLGETVGLALRQVLSCPIELNLMPPKVLAEKEFHKKQPFFLGAAAIVVLILAIWGGYFFRMSGLAEKRLAKVSAKVTNLEKIKKSLSRTQHETKAIADKVDQLLDLADSRADWLIMLDTIHASLPEGMWLTSLTPVSSVETTATGSQSTLIYKIVIEGCGYIDIIKSAGPIIEFRDALRKADDFAQRSEITRQPTPSQNDFVRKFTIDLVLENPLQL